MKTRHFRGGVAVVAATLCVTQLPVRAKNGWNDAGGSLAPRADNEQMKKSAEVDALLSPWSRRDSPGAAVMVIRDGGVLHRRGYGLADLETKSPIKHDTAFLLASATKPFTAMAVMMLAERGRLHYTDSLSKFFPEFPPYAERVTIRHLLTHTSGLPDYEELFLRSGLMDADWPRSAKSERSKYEPTAKDALALLFRQKELRFEPGEKWEYSNSGYVVLAQVVEKVSAQRFAQFLKENIFDPLGMGQSIVFDESQPAVSKRAASYTLQDGRYREIDYTPLNFIYGEDNVYSTLEDLAKWEQALYTERLVSTATLREAFTPAILNDGRLTRYGFGWEIATRSGLVFVEHPGAWVGFRTMIMRCPSRRFSVVVLSNCAQLEPEEIAHKVADIYLADTAPAP